MDKSSEYVRADNVETQSSLKSNAMKNFASELQEDFSKQTNNASQTTLNESRN